MTVIIHEGIRIILVQITQNISKTKNLHVLRQQEEHKPVTIGRFRHNLLQLFLRRQPRHRMQGIVPSSTRTEQHYFVQNRYDRADGQYDKPEPQQDVYLLVHDVEGQETQGIVLLDVAGWTESVEDALGESWEDPHHGVGPVFLIPSGKMQDISAISGELPT